VTAATRRHGKVLVLTEEPLMNSFAESLAGRIQRHCFEALDAPVFTLGPPTCPPLPSTWRWSGKCCPARPK
jgi:2-oxoisovalerate dehydrogenase E1 component